MRRRVSLPSMTYSIIVAVFNRPDEMDELLASLAAQTFTDFELLVVEDGSSESSEDVCKRYSDRIQIRYFTKDNSGPGLSRNYGCERADGDVMIFLDSDCMVPPDYLQSVEDGRLRDSFDAFGGPDREHDSFTPIQKAISFAMTSVLTTGGIRGSKVRVGGAFHPRSFNMGLSRKVYESTKGFAPMRFGEDVELSIRMISHGFRVGLIPEAWVYHKRRTDLGKFFKQVHNSGMARINITMLHPNTLKITHFFPTAFTTYVVFAIVYAVFIPLGVWSLLPIGLWAALIFISASIRLRSVVNGTLAVAASFVQMIGYGSGFVRGLIRRVLLNRPEGHAFKKSFYE